MKAFEYRVVDMLDPDTLSTRVPNKFFMEQRLNHFADQGWRVVHFDPMCTVLERAAAPKTPQMLVEDHTSAPFPPF